MSASTGDSFEEFLLSRIARNPALISETPQSISAESTLATLTDAHRRVLADFNAPPTAFNAAQHLQSPEATTLIQRGLLDPPLLPLGGEHLLYGNIWSAFVVAADAARRVGENSETTAVEERKRAEEKYRAAREKLCQAFEKVRILVLEMERCAEMNTTQLCEVRSLEKYFPDLKGEEEVPDESST